MAWLSHRESFYNISLLSDSWWSVGGASLMSDSWWSVGGASPWVVMSRFRMTSILLLWLSLLQGTQITISLVQNLCCSGCHNVHLKWNDRIGYIIIIYWISRRSFESCSFIVRFKRKVYGRKSWLWKKCLIIECHTNSDSRESASFSKSTLLN